MTVYDLLVDFTIASALILVGQFLRAKIKFFQEFFMPASMIAGFLGLFLGKQFLNVLPFSASAGSYTGVLIIIIFGVVGLNGFSGFGGVWVSDFLASLCTAMLFTLCSLTWYRSLLNYCQSNRA